MSSTNRGAQRVEHDYYVTRVEDVEHFLREWVRDDPAVVSAMQEGPILDPCAGGNISPVRWVFKQDDDGKPTKVYDLPSTPMSYPTAIQNVFQMRMPRIQTMDVRDDSPAAVKGDFLHWMPRPWERPRVIITNPPFSIAMEVIKHALNVVHMDGYVALLLRLNIFGSKKRKAFFQETPPQRSYVYGERPSFLPDGSTDSIEYQHAVWRPGAHHFPDVAPVAMLRVI